MNASPIRGEPEPNQGMCGASMGAIIDRVAPQPRGLGLAGARVEHRQWGVVDMELAALQADFPDPLRDRPQQRTTLPDPAGERGTVDIQALRSKHLGLAIERQMMIPL